MSVSSPEIGAILPGDYVLEAKLGDTTGHVYRARRQRDGRQVVARIFQPGLPLMAANFLELAQTASKVRHPSLANVEAYGRHGDRACFIISEFIQGQKLDEWADEVGIPPLGQVIDLMRRVCLGLAAAARGGLAHDSLNPSNVLVQKSVRGPGPRLPVKLLDLGVPAFLASREPRARAVRFMAPEQLAALASEDRSVAFRCTGTMNVYSCGCLLYYLCTGGPPYPGATIAELQAAQSGARMAPPVRINPQISPAFNSLILRALALEPSERFASVADLAEALANVSGSLHAHSKSSQPPASVQAVVPLMSTPIPDDDEPPTFKTARPPEVHELAARLADDDEGQTLPPGPNMAAFDTGPPIGLFSSAPPWQARRSPTPPPPMDSTVPRATPLALFSEPPPPASPPLREPSRIIVAKAEPHASLLIGPYDPGAVRRSRQWRTRGFGGWFLPLGAAACVAGYYLISRLLAADPGPIAAIEPAANSGSVSAPVAPPSSERKPGAQVAAPEQAMPAARVDPTDPVTTAVAPPAVQVAVIERSRDRGHGRAAPRGNSRDLRAVDNAPLEPVREELSEAHNNEPVAVASPEHDAGVAHSRLTAPVPEKMLAAEPAPAKSVASKPVLPTPARVEPKLPLMANVQVQSITVRGSLPTSLVRRAAERLRPQLAACYARAARLAGRNAFGELSVELQIDERGRARNPTSHGGGLPQLDACVADAASKLVSEKAPDTGTVNASWKVAFTP